MAREWEQEYKEKLTTPQEAVKLVKSGDTVFLGICTSVAYGLAEALGERKNELEDVTLSCSQVLQPLKILSGDNPGAFRVNTCFMGVQERKMYQKGLADYTSVHLGQVDIWCKETVPADVAFFQVSEPDADGYVTYGSSGVALNCYVKESAKKIVLEINPNVPRVYGDLHKMHISEAYAIVKSDYPIVEYRITSAAPEVETISDFLLEQIPDGACIQLGIGGVADAVGYGLKDRNDLGVHTELMTDTIMKLMKMGVVNNSRKTYLPGKSVVGFSFGSRELYEFSNENPNVYFMPLPVINDPYVIAKNDNVISINTAMAVDLYGQVCSENLTGRQYSGTGGQVDFVRGAQMSKGGKSFIALTSMFKNRKGEKNSRIVTKLPAGAVVTTPRSDVQYVATEYGCVNLKPLTMKHRVEAMISLADPDVRSQLRSEAKEAGML